MHEIDKREVKLIKINFVCLGNICRSPMAEFLFKDFLRKKGIADGFEIHSSATSRYEIGNPVYPPARKILNEHGIDCSKKRAVQLKCEDGEYYDYIVCMDGSNLRDISRIFGGRYMDKVYTLLSFCGGGDVADPYYTGDFEKTYSDITRGISGFYEFLTKTCNDLL